MALIGTIRKNFWFVLILLGFALAAFVMMDMTSAGNRGGGVGSMTMGQVAGEKIDYKEFQTTESAYYGNSGGETYSKRNSIWNFFVERALVRKEANQLGLKVSADELTDLQFGEKVSPVVQANWRNPQTGQVDKARLMEFKNVIESGEEMNPQFKSFWYEQQKQIVKSQLQTKINNLVKKGIYTPTWMAEGAHKEDNDKVDFKYVKIPFDHLADTDVEVSDADYNAYISENAHTYENKEETRTMEYASYEVVPTAEDSTAISNQVNDMRTRFVESDNDSLFAINNNGSFVYAFYKLDDLPESSRDFVNSLSVGEVTQPFISDKNYNLVKLLEKKVIPDSVEAKHLLRRADRNDPVALANAESFVDSLFNLIKSGKESFNETTKLHSQDVSNAEKAGDLGTFGPGAMVKEFNDICFYKGKRGGIYKTITQYGVHLVKIENLVYNTRDEKYRIASATVPIVPSENTQEAVYDMLSDLLSENRDMESFKAAVEDNENIELSVSSAVNQNDFTVDDLGAGQTSRDMIKWAFDVTNEVGDISPEIYSVTDPVNYYNSKYVIAGLKEIVPAGLPTSSSIKEKISTLVLNRKKGEKIASDILGGVSSLDELAAKYETTVETASDVSFKSQFVPGIGNEQKVISSAYLLDNMSISKPIVGTSGVYVIQPLSKLDAEPVSNLALVKSNVSTNTRTQVDFKIIESMKNAANVEDQRNTFF